MFQPKLFSITKCATADPRSLSTGINVLPGSLVAWTIEREAGEPVQSHFRILRQFGDLVRKPPIGKPVVVVPMNDDFSSCLFASQVVFRAHGATLLHPNVPDARVVRNQI